MLASFVAGEVHDANDRHEAIFAAELGKTAEETGVNTGSVEGKNFHQEEGRCPAPGQDHLSEAVCQYIEQTRQGDLDLLFANKKPQEAQSKAEIDGQFARGLKGMESRSTLLERNARFGTMSERSRNLY